MAMPVGVQTCTVTVGSQLNLFGDDASLKVTVTPVLSEDRRANTIVWEATGQPLTDWARTYTATAGTPATFAVPVVDQDGFVGEGSDGWGEVKFWWYEVKIEGKIGTTGPKKFRNKRFQVLEGDTTLDLDTLPDGEVVQPAYAPRPERVASVNGQTGDVVLDAADVGAIDQAALDAEAAARDAADDALAASIAAKPDDADIASAVAAEAVIREAADDALTASLADKVDDTDPRLSDSRTPTGGAGGVLSGNYPNPGFAVDMATQGELDTVAGVASSAVQPGDLATVATTGDYDDLTDKPSLSTVATTGSYSDLTGKPTLGTAAAQNSAAFDAAGSASAAQTAAVASSAQKSANLSDLANAGSARTNLGLGTAATEASTSFATVAQGTKADTASQPADVTASRVGQYLTIPAGTYQLPRGTRSTGAQILDRLSTIPIYLPQARTATRIAVEVTTAASAGGVLRLGIYNVDTSTGLPTTLVLDAGTVASDSIGAKEITISQALPAGWYALASAPQVATCTTRILTLNAGVELGASLAKAFGGSQPVGWYRSGVSGALPSPHGTVADVSGDPALMAIRF